LRGVLSVPVAIFFFSQDHLHCCVVAFWNDMRVGFQARSNVTRYYRLKSEQKTFKHRISVGRSCGLALFGGLPDTSVFKICQSVTWQKKRSGQKTWLANRAESKLFFNHDQTHSIKIPALMPPKNCRFPKQTKATLSASITYDHDVRGLPAWGAPTPIRVRLSPKESITRRETGARHRFLTKGWWIECIAWTRRHHGSMKSI